MSLKDQLIAESKNIDTAVELDSVFESVELNEDTKTKFSAVFESAVKARALTLAESHIEAISARADELVESRVEEEISELNESVNTYFDHLVTEWKEDNKVALENGMKVDIFESLMGSLKAVFVEHNIEVPTESVNVVSELEAELAESTSEMDKLVRNNRALSEELDSLKMKDVVKESTAALTESQKEKVMTLIEGTKFDDKFLGKLNAIVEMVSATKTPAESASKPEDTANQEKSQTKAATDKTQSGAAGNKSGKINEDLDGLNGEPAPIVEAKKAPSIMDQYVRAI